MAASSILTFGQGAGANVLSQAAYNADSQRQVGNQPGVARAQLVNKALLQASALAAGLAKFIANGQGNDISDQLTVDNIAAYLKTAVQASDADNLGGSNQHLNINPGYQKFPGGIILQWGAGILPIVGGSNNSSQAVSWNIAFPTLCAFALAAPTQPGNTNILPTIGTPTVGASGGTFTGCMPAGVNFGNTCIYGYIAWGW